MNYKIYIFLMLCVFSLCCKENRNSIENSVPAIGHSEEDIKQFVVENVIPKIDSSKYIIDLPSRYLDGKRVTGDKRFLFYRLRGQQDVEMKPFLDSLDIVYILNQKERFKNFIWKKDNIEVI